MVSKRIGLYSFFFFPVFSSESKHVLSDFKPKIQVQHKLKMTRILNEKRSHIWEFMSQIFYSVEIQNLHFI